MRLIRSTVAASLCAAILAVSSPAGVRAAAPNTQNVTRATLANGLQVVIIRDTLAPVVATWLNYRAGSNEEPATGIAHAQEHMMFRGSRSLSASQFHETTAITGGNFNADTQSAVTQYFFEMPAQYLDIALSLEASRAQKILDTEALWNQERGAITQEVTSANSSAIFRLLDKSVKHVFAGTPYANFGLGTVEGFKKMHAADLKTYYDKWYHPNNAVFVIVGDVDPQKTLAKVRALFGKIPAKPLPARPTVRLRPLTPVTLTDDSDDPITFAVLAYRVPGNRSKDFFAQKILNDVLNNPRGALGSLRFSGKSLQTFAQTLDHELAGLELVGSVVPVTTKGAQAIDDVKTVVEAYKKTGLPDDLVEVAKAKEIARAEQRRTSIGGLASLWSEALAVENRTPDDDLAALERVTTADVDRVLRTYYDNSTVTALIATPKTANPTGGGAGRGAEDNDVVPTEHKPLPKFAQAVLDHLSVPVDATTPSESTLPNGLKLVVVSEPYAHSVVVRGRVVIEPGIQDHAGKDGVDDVAAQLLAFGTTAHDRVAYQTELDKIAADVRPGSDFSLDVPSSQFDRGVDLLAEAELHPAFPAEAFPIVQRQTIGALTGQNASPDFLARQALLKALYPENDPARRFATPQSAASLTLDDVKAQYAATYRPDLTTIVVVGDVTVAGARAAIARAFGGWTATGPKPELDPKPVAANVRTTAQIPATGRIQATVALAQTLALPRKDPAYPLLDLANTVLTGGFYASLLYHDLRELHGYVYNVNSTLKVGKTRGEFRIGYASDPSNVARAEKLVVDDLVSLEKTGIPADRLQRSKALLLGGMPVARESYAKLATRLLGNASDNLPLDQDTRDAAAVLAATADDVRAALAKWVRPSDFVRVVTGPGPA